jgi:O-antigen ligase
VKDVALVNFWIDFKSDAIQLQGFLFFALLIYLVASLWGSIQDRMRAGGWGALWFAFSLSVGAFIGIVSAFDWGSEFILIALSIGLSIGLALTHPAAAVCLLTSLLFLRPWELLDKNDYFAILPKLSFTLCTAHVVLILAARRKLALAWNATTLVLIAYAAWCFMTTFRAPDPAMAQLEYFDTFFKSLFLYLMITNALHDEADLRALMGTMLITFLGVGMICVYQTLGVSEATGVDARLRGIGAFTNPNDVAALMVLVFPFALFQTFRRDQNRVVRSLAVAVMGVAAFAIFLSQSRGAMGALGLTLVLFVALRMKNKWITIGTAVAMLAAVPVMLAAGGRSEDDLSASGSSRMTYIKTGLIMGAKNPVFGVGFSGYEENFERYATEMLHEWGNRTAHNSWILTFAETGLLGLLLFVTVFVTATFYAWRIYPSYPEFFLSIIAYGIAISFLSHSYLIYPYLLYGLISVAHRVRSKADPDLAPAPAAA